MFALPLSAAGQTSGSSAPKWGPHLDFEAKPGSKRSLGEGDLFVPLMQDERTLFFGNLRARFDDQSSREGNLGLGVRRMLEGGWNIGGYGYLDRRKSETGNYFSQVTLGGEALGRDWDFRGNAYLPQGDRLRDLGSTPGGSTAAVSGTSVIVTTTGPTLREERALRGFDAEVGWRVPLLDADEPRQLRVYAGGYRFKDDVVKVSGPRVRAELTVAELPQLWRGAQLIAGAEAQDDSARGGQVFLSVRLRVPLGGSVERPRQSFQERRMTAPVMRDVDIVTQSRTLAAAPPVVETATGLADGRAFTVIDSGSTANLGTAVAALPNNSTALLSGTFNVSGGTAIDLGGAKSLVAGTMTVRTPSGVTTTLNSPATILSTANRTIQAPGGNTISGLTINVTANGASPIAIALNDTAGNYNILNNTVTMTQAGAAGLVGISVARNFNVVISGNSLTLTGGTGSTALAFAGSPANPVTATVTGNTLNVSGATTNRAVLINSDTTINAGSAGNVLISGACNTAGSNNTGSISFTDGTHCP